LLGWLLGGRFPRELLTARETGRERLLDRLGLPHLWLTGLWLYRLGLADLWFALLGGDLRLADGLGLGRQHRLHRSLCRCGLCRHRLLGFELPTSGLLLDGRLGRLLLDGGLADLWLYRLACLVVCRLGPGELLGLFVLLWLSELLGPGELL
jgi:hypothetical protein